MEMRIGDQQPIPGTPVYIEYITYSGTPGDITATLQLSQNIDDLLSDGLAITFHGDRNLNFHPDRNITGLNVIDGMIFWTDNHSEPKKVNIERGKIGSRSWLYGAGYDGTENSPPPLTWSGVGSSATTTAVCNGGDPSLACYSDFDQHTRLIITEDTVMECEKSTYSCDIFGCTDSTAYNYNPLANTDDGSCVLPIPIIYGCDNGTYGVTNSNACNSGMTYWGVGGIGNIITGISADATYDYNTNDTNLCVFPDTCTICDGNGGLMTDPLCGGCMDTSTAIDGSIAATNYAPLATNDCSNVTGGTDIDCCEYCLDPTALNYYAAGANDCSGTPGGTDYVSCCNYPVIVVDGCMDPNADNYNASATQGDGSCEYHGCTNVSAPNYSFTGSNPAVDSNAGQYVYLSGTAVDDGSCIVPSWDCNFDAALAQGEMPPTSYALNCEDPGDGSGEHSTLSDCQDACIEGCTDIQDEFGNYDPLAVYNPYDELLNVYSSTGVTNPCQYCDYGCMFSGYDNYNSTATCDDNTCCNDYGPLFTVYAHPSGFGYGEALAPYLTSSWLNANASLFTCINAVSGLGPIRNTENLLHGINFNCKADLVAWANFVWNDNGGTPTSPFTTSDTYYDIKWDLIGQVGCTTPNSSGGDCGLLIGGNTYVYVTPWWSPGFGPYDSIFEWEANGTAMGSTTTLPYRSLCGGTYAQQNPPLGPVGCTDPNALCSATITQCYDPTNIVLGVSGGSGTHPCCHVESPANSGVYYPTGCDT